MLQHFSRAKKETVSSNWGQTPGQTPGLSPKTVKYAKKYEKSKPQLPVKVSA
jgi:hypothetical protein